MESDPRARLIVGSIMLLILVGLILVLIGETPLLRGIVIHVDFNRVERLKVGTKIRIAGRLVGRVLAIRQINTHQHQRPGSRSGNTDPKAQRVRIDLWIDQHSVSLVREGSVFFLNAKSLIGEQSIQIWPPEGPLGKPATAGQLFQGIDTPALDRLFHVSFTNMRAMNGFIHELEPQMRALFGAYKDLSKTFFSLSPSFFHTAKATQELLASTEMAWKLWREGSQDNVLARRAWSQVQTLHAKTGGRIKQLRTRLNTLTRRLALLLDLLPPQRRQRVSKALLQLRQALERSFRMKTQLAQLSHWIKRGEGTIGRMLKDPDLVDELKEAHRLLKQQPWRTLSRPFQRKHRKAVPTKP